MVLKVRRISGVETLSLRHAELGSFAMPREWTDWAPPEAPAGAASPALMVDAFGLAAVAALVFSLRQDSPGVDR